MQNFTIAQPVDSIHLLLGAPNPKYFFMICIDLFLLRRMPQKSSKSDNFEES